MDLKNIIERKEFDDLAKFNDKITLSKVVEFFEKKEIYFTKTMIQNYVRVGVVPPPIQKRYYTKKHMILLFIINMLKSVYSLDEIKNVFDPILKEPRTFDDDMLDVSVIYNLYLKFYKTHMKNMKNILSFDITKEVGDVPIDKLDDEDINIFLNKLNIMALSVASKETVKDDTK